MTLPQVGFAKTVKNFKTWPPSQHHKGQMNGAAALWERGRGNPSPWPIHKTLFNVKNRSRRLLLAFL